MTSANPSPLDFANSPINQSLSRERKIELFTQMVRIRRFEQAGLVKGEVHHVHILDATGLGAVAKNEGTSPENKP